MSWSQIPTFKRDEKGIVFINPAKQFIQPFELSIDKPNQIVTLLGGQSVGPFTLTAQFDGPIEIFYVKVVVYDEDDVPVTTYDIDWFLEHPGKRVQFMPRPTSLMACAGDGGRPYVLPESIFIPAVQSLNVSFTNNDAVNTRKIELVLGGVKFYPFSAPERIRGEVYQYADRRERTYCYFQTTDEPISVAVGLTDQNFFFTMPDNTDLEIFKLTAQCTGPFRALIRDGQNDRALTGNKIHSSLLFGGHHTDTFSGIGGSGGIFPYRWPTTWLVRRSTKSQITLDNLFAGTNVIEMVFGGRKVAYA